MLLNLAKRFAVVRTGRRRTSYSRDLWRSVREIGRGQPRICDRLTPYRRRCDRIKETQTKRYDCTAALWTFGCGSSGLHTRAWLRLSTTWLHVSSSRGDLDEAKSYAEQAVRILGTHRSAESRVGPDEHRGDRHCDGRSRLAEPLYREPPAFGRRRLRPIRGMHRVSQLREIYVIQGRYAAAEKSSAERSRSHEDEQTASYPGFVLRLQGRMTEAGRLQKSFEP